MLTKWGAALGLASAGRIVAGGGGNTGIPLGPFADWASLPASAQGGALAVVLDTDGAGSDGIAQFDAGVPEWQLQFGYFATEADLLAFPHAIASNALAAVGPSLDDPASVRWQWDGSQWVRTPELIDYIWPTRNNWAALSTLENLQSGDRAGLKSLGPAGSSGTAEYTNSWSLIRATFATEADMNAFAQPIANRAIAGVPNFNPTSVIYVYDDTLSPPAWVRTPDGIGYIWGQVANWAGLVASGVANSKNNDEVPVADLGTTHSSGTAQKHGGTSWRLVDGKFASVADMTAFDTSYDVAAGAVAQVKAGGSHDQQSIAYTYQGGAFVRFGATTTQGYAWTLTETQLLDGTDPSGIGAVQEGDYGILAASGGPIVVRYKVVTIAAGAGGGTRAMWIPPAAYAGTNLVLDSFALGTESDAQLAAQGLAVTETNTGTVGTTGGYTDLIAPAVGAANSVALLTSPVITGAKKFAVMCQIRGSVSSSSAAAGLFQSSAQNNTQWTLAAGGGVSTSVFQLQWTGAWALANNAATTRGGGSAWPGIASTPWLLMAETGAAISDLIQTRVNGAVYSTFRRNNDSAVDGDNYTAGIQAVGGTAGVNSRLQIKNYFRLVWD